MVDFPLLCLTTRGYHQQSLGMGWSPAGCRSLEGDRNLGQLELGPLVLYDNRNRKVWVYLIITVDILYPVYVHTIPYNTIQHDTPQHNTIQYNTIYIYIIYILYNFLYDYIYICTATYEHAWITQIKTCRQGGLGILGFPQHQIGLDEDQAEAILETVSAMSSEEQARSPAVSSGRGLRTP
jgi:hypothetical protein